MTSPQTFYAILAMDAYNRGYGASIDLRPRDAQGNVVSDPQNGNQPTRSDKPGTQIGNAIVSTNSTDEFGQGVDSDIDFYALAYDVGGVGTVISYRGTDNLPVDSLYGYGVAVGVPNVPQAEMAFAFYREVAGDIDPRTANISVTGHSLGGGLAGLVGSVYLKEGLLFDNMPFELASNNTALSALIDLTFGDVVYGNYNGGFPWAPSISGLTAYSLDGEFLAWARPKQQTPDIQLPIGPNVNLPGVDAGGLHSQASQVIRLYFQDQDGQPVPSFWGASAKYFWPVTYDDEFAQRIGVDAVPGRGTENEEYSGVMRQLIAYSAIEEGGRPFGDTGVAALYDDANNLGEALILPGLNNLVEDYAEDISKVFVNYATQLALNDVEREGNVDPVLNGVLTTVNFMGTSSLTVNLSDAAWDLTGTLPAQGQFQARVDLLTRVQQTQGVRLSSVTDYVIFASDTDEPILMPQDASGPGYNNLFIGDESAQHVIGGAGSDVFITGGGDDVIEGGAGNDQIFLGHDAVTADGNDGDDLYVILNNGASAHTLNDTGISGSDSVFYTQDFRFGTDINAFGMAEGIEFIEVSDGTRFDIAALESSAVISYDGNAQMLVEGTGGQDRLSGTQSGLTLDGKGGNDFATISTGVTYVESGGNDVIAGNGGTLQLAGGINNYSYAVAANGNIVVTKGNGETITLSDDLDALQFGAGGSEVALEDVLASVDVDFFTPDFVKQTYRGGDEDNIYTANVSGDVIFAGGGANEYHFDAANFSGTVSIDAEIDDQIDLIDISGFGSVNDVRMVFEFGGLLPTVQFADTKIIMASGSLDGASTHYQVNAAGDEVVTLADLDVVIESLNGASGDINGYSIDDYIIGSDFDGEELYGLSGDDVIEGREGIDEIYGGIGNDELYGGTGDDELYGGDGDDTLDGGEGDDVIDGGAGSDTFYDSVGDDTYSVDGDDEFIVLSGFDTLNVASGNLNGLEIDFSAHVSVDDGGNILNNGFYRDYTGSHSGFHFALGYDEGIVTLSGMENVTGSPIIRLTGSESISLNGSQMVGYGSDLNDVYAEGLSASMPALANDLVYAGDGDDNFSFLYGDDAVYGEGGNDTLSGGFGDDLLDGGEGNDIIIDLNGGDNQMFGGEGDDQFSLNFDGGDIVDGGDGTDTVLLMTASYGATTLYNYTIDLATQTVTNSEGVHTLSSIENAAGSLNNDTLIGNGEDNELSGTGGDDILQGGLGNDRYIYGDLSVFGTDNGHDIITDAGGESDALKFEQISAIDDLSVTEIGDDLLISVADGSIQITDQLLSGSDTQIEQVILANDQVFDLLDYENWGTDTGGAGNPQQPDADGAYFTGTATTGENFIGTADKVDTVDYSASDAVITVDLSSVQAAGGYADGDVLASIENIIGSNVATFGETLTGNDDSNSFDGLAGNDYLIGGGGDDFLTGGADADILDGGAGVDTAIYENAFSTYMLDTSPTASGFITVTDTIGNEGADTVFITVEFFQFADGVYDVATGTFYAATAMDDVFIGTSAVETFDGGDGVDTVDYSASQAAISVDLLNGTASGGDADGDVLISIENVIGSDETAPRDYIWGDDQANHIEGMAGNDILEAGAGADIIDGGAGWDYARYTRSTEGVTINLSTGIHAGGDAAGDILIDIEAIVGSAHNDMLIGVPGNDFLRGGAGDDMFYGNAGTNRLYGEAGSDSYHFDGDTTLIFESANDTSSIDTVIFADQFTVEDVIVNGNVVTFQNAPGDEIAFDDITRIEGFDILVDGQRSTITLTTLQSFSAPVTVVFDSGVEVISATAAAEHFEGNGESNTVDYSNSEFGVWVDLLAGTGSGGDAEGDTYNSVENVNGADITSVNGSNAADYRDYLWGNGEVNVLNGLGGDDILEGDVGADILNGGEGWDYARYLRSDEAVNINLETGIHTGGHAAGDVLSNIEAITGSNHNDILRGGDSNDYLNGADGDDQIYGGKGGDVLVGGDGADTFHFEDPESFFNFDRINDYDAGEGDVINIDDVIAYNDLAGDAISDFVELTSDGTHTSIGINQQGDGTGFTKIIELRNTSGHDLQDMIDNGEIVV